jgi:Ceramidase
MDGLFASLDIYCERTDAGLWAEPVNALTNLLIICAGFFGLAQVRSRGTGVYAEVLSWWVVVIGFGSLLFHTTAIELTKWADIIPIATFTLAMAIFCLRRFSGLDWSRTVAYLVSYLAIVSIVTWLIPSWLSEATNGTTAYLPALAGFAFFGIVALIHGSPAGWYCIACAIILSAGFVFRAVDQGVCEAFPLGTHFIWHVLIALMLAVNLMAVAKYGAPRRAGDRS